MEINELCSKAFETAARKGFWKDECNFNVVYGDIAYAEAINLAFKAQRLMLIVSELGEALEALRKNDTENFVEEIGDVFIRLGDFCGGYGIDIETAIKDKMEINETRPPKHGKAF